MGSPGYWLPYCVAAGTWQMEQDTWLLQRLRHAPRPYLRFYGWDRLTLSLGRHQAWPDPAPGIPVVRRPTGGRAVLHQAAEDGAELTYSLVLPLSYLQARLPRLQRTSVYDFCCRFWVKGLAELGVEVDPILPAHNRAHGQNRPALDSGYRNKTSCFAARTRADLSWGGKKLMGNAQLWQPWGILQQGSLLLRPNFELWERYLPGSQVIGLYDLCPTAPGIPALMEHFLQMAQECFEVEWQEETWPDPLHWEDPAGIADPE